MKYLLMLLVFGALVSVGFSACVGPTSIDPYIKAMINITDANGIIISTKTDQCTDLSNYIKYKCSQDGTFIDSENFSCNAKQICDGNSWYAPSNIVPTCKSNQICNGPEDFDPNSIVTVNVTNLTGSLINTQTDKCESLTTYSKNSCSQDGTFIYTKLFACDPGTICDSSNNVITCKPLPPETCGDGATVCNYPQHCATFPSDPPTYYCADQGNFAAPGQKAQAANVVCGPVTSSFSDGRYTKSVCVSSKSVASLSDDQASTIYNNLYYSEMLSNQSVWTCQPINESWNGERYTESVCTPS